MVILILIAFIAACLLADVAVQYVRKKKISAVTVTSPISSCTFDETSVSVPNGLYFDRSHTWAHMKKNGIVKIGLDDFLLKITGPLTHIEMKKAGEKIKKGFPAFSIIQNGKKLTIKAPISGTVKFPNAELVKNSSTINSSPYNNGWIYMIEPSNWIRDTKFLIMAEKYKEWLRNEFSRLKDFFAVYSKTNMPEYAYILQDGGVLKDNVLADMEPEVWEDFQTNFIDSVN